MNKMFKLLAVCAIAVALTACGDETPQSSTDVVEYTGTVTLPPAKSGIKEGTQEDLVARAGNMIHFGTDEYSLSKEAQRVLKLQSLWLKQYENVSIVIEGHCDERGTKKYNYALGERRANAAKAFLIAQGIKANRIQTVSYGKDKPLDPASNESAWSRNRRDVTVIAQ